VPLDRPFTMPRGADPPRERLDRGFSSVPAATTPPPRAVRGARAILPDERPGADLPDAPRALAVSLREPAGESGLSPAPSSMSGGELLDAFFERTPPPRRAGELSRFSFPRFATVLFGPWTRVLEAGLCCSLQLLLDHLLVPPLSGGGTIRSRRGRLRVPQDCVRGEEARYVARLLCGVGRPRLLEGVRCAPALLTLTSPSRASTVCSRERPRLS